MTVPASSRRQHDLRLFLPRVCGTCQHWDGAVDGLGYASCRVVERSGTLVARLALQDCAGRAWEPEPNEANLRRCADGMGDWGALVQTALALAGRRDG